MTKRILIKLIAILLSFAIGFLLCLFTVKSEKQEWTELEAKRLRQIERISRMMERMTENYYDMIEWNEQAIIEPENTK